VLSFVLKTRPNTNNFPEMDELFGSAGFAEADNALRLKIEQEIGLTGLIYGTSNGEEEKIGETAEKREIAELKEDRRV